MEIYEKLSKRWRCGKILALTMAALSDDKLAKIVFVHDHHKKGLICVIIHR